MQVCCCTFLYDCFSCVVAVNYFQHLYFITDTIASFCIILSLYKDVFNNCSIGKKSIEEFKLLGIISNIQTLDVGSWVQICYCGNGLPDCSKQIPYINVKTGEKAILDVAIAC